MSSWPPGPERRDAPSQTGWMSRGSSGKPRVGLLQQSASNEAFPADARQLKGRRGEEINSTRAKIRHRRESGRNRHKPSRIFEQIHEQLSPAEPGHRQGGGTRRGNGAVAPTADTCQSPLRGGGHFSVTGAPRVLHGLGPGGQALLTPPSVCPQEPLSLWFKPRYEQRPTNPMAKHSQRLSGGDGP